MYVHVRVLVCMYVHVYCNTGMYVCMYQVCILFFEFSTVLQASLRLENFTPAFCVVHVAASPFLLVRGSALYDCVNPSDIDGVWRVHGGRAGILRDEHVVVGAG